jgi:hypothetical protein
MPMKENRLNAEVTAFLDRLNHPLRDLIEALRQIISSAHSELSEGIKWNAPSYSLNHQDRITLKLFPHKQVQVIFYRGAKTKEQPAERLIKDDHGLLSWKENDRAVATTSRSSPRRPKRRQEPMTPVIPF